jgi:hypothetical protein
MKLSGSGIGDPRSQPPHALPTANVAISLLGQLLLERSEPSSGIQVVRRLYLQAD